MPTFFSLRFKSEEQHQQQQHGRQGETREEQLRRNSRRGFFFSDRVTGCFSSGIREMDAGPHADTITMESQNKCREENRPSFFDGGVDGLNRCRSTTSFAGRTFRPDKFSRQTRPDRFVWRASGTERQVSGESHERCRGNGTSRSHNASTSVRSPRLPSNLPVNFTANAPAIRPPRFRIRRSDSVSMCGCLAVPRPVLPRRARHHGDKLCYCCTCCPADGGFNTQRQ